MNGGFTVRAAAVPLLTVKPKKKRGRQRCGKAAGRAAAMPQPTGQKPQHCHWQQGK